MRTLSTRLAGYPSQALDGKQFSDADKSGHMEKSVKRNDLAGV